MGFLSGDIVKGSGIKVVGFIHAPNIIYLVGGETRVGKVRLEVGKWASSMSQIGLPKGGQDGWRIGLGWFRLFQFTDSGRESGNLGAELGAEGSNGSHDSISRGFSRRGGRGGWRRRDSCRSNRRLHVRRPVRLK